MRFFVLLSCLFMPFAMAYFIKNTEVSWYAYLTIPIVFGFLIAYYLINNSDTNQFSWKTVIFKSKFKK